MPTSLAVKSVALVCILVCSAAVAGAALPGTYAATAQAKAAQKNPAKKTAPPASASNADDQPSADGFTQVDDRDANRKPAAPTIFQEPTMRAEGGSILRQVSGLQGKEDPAKRPLEPIVLPQSYAESFDAKGLATIPNQTGEGGWVSPYQASPHAVVEEDYGWLEYLPQGMVPFWGPRTPASERCSAWGETILGTSQFADCGEPLVGTSWLNRPFGASIYLGAMDGGPLISPYLTQGSGFAGGVRLSWDYDYFWGAETRLGVSYLKLNNALSPIAPDSTNVFQWDVSLLYYPWGDTRWRPYFIAGLGLTSFRYIDQYYNVSANGSFTIPFGMGLKYQLREYLVARVEVLDNWAMSGNTLDTMHNVSGSMGLEFRFGGGRKNYWPWYPGKYVY